MRHFNFWLHKAGSKYKYKSRHTETYLAEWIKIFSKIICPLYNIEESDRKLEIFFDAIVLSMPRNKAMEVLSAFYGSNSHELELYKIQINLRRETTKVKMQELYSTNSFFKLVIDKISEIIKEVGADENKIISKQISFVIEKIH